MKYIDYIDRGFERCELNDTVQYERTGHKSYYLIKRLTKSVAIQLWDSELDNPKMYIDVEDGDFITLPLTGEMVMSWFEKSGDLY